MGLPTMSGSQFCHSAQDRIIRRNPTARTKARRMTAVVLDKRVSEATVESVLLSPAAMAYSRGGGKEVQSGMWESASAVGLPSALISPHYNPVLLSSLLLDSAHE